MATEETIMKVLKCIGRSIATILVLTNSAWAQYGGGGYGNDEITSSLGRTISWLQIAAISIISLYVISNLIRMGKDDEEGPRAKKHVVMGLVAMAGVMLLRGIINLVQQLTASSISVGF